MDHRITGRILSFSRVIGGGLIPTGRGDRLVSCSFWYRLNRPPEDMTAKARRCDDSALFLSGSF
jgi:hypothetical protein